MDRQLNSQLNSQTETGGQNQPKLKVSISLVPRPLPKEERAWYTLFAHARKYPRFLWGFV